MPEGEKELQQRRIASQRLNDEGEEELLRGNGTFCRFNRRDEPVKDSRTRAMVGAVEQMLE